MTLELFGVGFAPLSLEQAVELCRARDPAAAFAYVVTPNTDHLARLRRDPPLRPAYAAAWLCLLDSEVIGVLLRRLGRQPVSVVTGADLTAQLLARLPRGSSVLLVGLSEADAQALAVRFDHLVIEHYQPPMGLDTDSVAFARVCAVVRAQQAALVLLAVGSPRQERLAYAIAQAGDATGLGLCVGAAPLFAARRIRRAPAWIRALALEWAWRLALEPRRLARRYVWDGPPVLVALALIALKRRRTLVGGDDPRNKITHENNHG